MRFRVILLEHAKADVRSLSPVPKRLVRRALRGMEGDPYALDTIRLQRPEVQFRVRVGDHRILFEPVPACERSRSSGSVTESGFTKAWSGLRQTTKAR